MQQGVHIAHYNSTQVSNRGLYLFSSNQESKKKMFVNEYHSIVSKKLVNCSSHSAFTEYGSTNASADIEVPAIKSQQNLTDYIQVTQKLVYLSSIFCHKETTTQFSNGGNGKLDFGYLEVLEPTSFCSQGQ